MIRRIISVILLVTMAATLFAGCAGKQEEQVKLSEGDEIVLGSFDGTDLEWIVVDTDDEGAFLVSKYAVAEMAFNTDIADTSWETCSLRTWLNEDFYNEAFSSSDKEKIILSDVGSKVFLLDRDETCTYFPTDESRKVLPLPGSDILTFKEHCYWWLRTSGCGARHALYVHDVGIIDDYGFSVYNPHCCVRPAIWIKN